VKCGEERPSCARCIKFETECSYTSAKSTRTSIFRPIYPSVPPNLADQGRPSLFHIDVEGGYQYFHLFASGTSFEILSHSSDIDSLRLILLQAGASQPRIRYALAAPGDLGKTSETAPILQYDDHWGESSPHHQNALKSYSRAVTHMKNAISMGSQSLRMTLLMCFVILCFEAWNGNQVLTIQQMQTGIKLIQEWRNGTKSSLRKSPSISAVEEDLIRVFERLAVLLASYTTARTRSTACNDIL